jgi:hypothetical protein
MNATKAIDWAAPGWINAEWPELEINPYLSGFICG